MDFMAQRSKKETFIWTRNVDLDLRICELGLKLKVKPIGEKNLDQSTSLEL